MEDAWQQALGPANPELLAWASRKRRLEGSPSEQATQGRLESSNPVLDLSIPQWIPISHAQETISCVEGAKMSYVLDKVVPRGDAGAFGLVRAARAKDGTIVVAKELRRVRHSPLSLGLAHLPQELEAMSVEVSARMAFSGGAIHRNQVWILRNKFINGSREVVAAYSDEDGLLQELSLPMMQQIWGLDVPRALDHELPVPTKFIRLLSDRAAVLQEVAAMTAAPHHPHLLPLLDAGEVITERNLVPFLVLPLAACDLNDLVSFRQPGAELATELFTQVSAA